MPFDRGTEKEKVAQYLYEISDYNQDFVLTMFMENGELTADRKHKIPHWCKRTGRLEYDWGFGISACYHPEVTNDPRFTDYKWQGQKAWEYYSGGVKFYGYNNRHKARKFFEFK
jgi:hypothetical protein